MPWISNAAYKVINSWLPPKAIPKIKCVHKSYIQEFVDSNDVLISWGGNNDYTFRFVSEVQNNTDATMNGKLDNKKVLFAESSPITEQSPSIIGDQTNEEELLSIEPKTIRFNKTGNEIADTITLKNITTDKPLSYKIKTTSPEKFRVRPSSGVLLPQEQRTVSVVLQPGYNLRGLLHNDRFLVMGLPLKDANPSAQELVALWKSETAAEQHRLRCCDGETENFEVHKSHDILSSGISDNGRTIDTLFYKISQLKESNTKLHNDIIFLKYLIMFSIIMGILMAVMIVFFLRIDIQNSVNGDACHMTHGIEIFN
ncbi:motile sperm domain-containing protein 2-like [Ptiloglossa arizonensis]|uniref:motile sperm domain-containing protein 2-like n=1 Tax=Ptiloglossa arizonensis TaxID=3350558 RepID=UPI003FA12F41